MTPLTRTYRVGLELTGDVQEVRALDVAVVGPAMIAAGLWLGPLPALLRAALALFGVTTVVYNWRRMRP